MDIESSVSAAYAVYIGKVSAAVARYTLEISSTHPVIFTDVTQQDYACGRWLIAGIATQDGHGSIGAAVASAQVAGKGNQVLTDARGLPNDATLAVQAAGNSQLNASSVRPFAEAFSTATKWCVENAANATPAAQPGAVFELSPTEYDPLETACWALNSLAKGWSAEEATASPGLPWDAVRRCPLTVDALSVAAIYHRLGVRPDRKPTTLQKQRATEILGGTKPMPDARDQLVPWMVDVPPYVRENGVVPALERLTANPDRIRIGAWPAVLVGPPNHRTYFSEVSASLALAAGAAGLVDVSSKSSARYCRYGFLQEYGCPGQANSLILNERYARGFQTFIRFVSSENSVDALVIAAKATVENARTSMEIQILGVDLGAVSTLAGLFPAAINGFDISTVSAMGAVDAQISAVGEGTPSFVPCLSGVEVNLGAPEVQALAAPAAEYRAGLIAVRSLTKRSVATVANGQPRPDVAFVYDRLGVGEQPTKPQKDAAARLLNAGL
ncbi:MAG: hypothetical protein HZB16_02860 [Armatimonadetes bacterium]|nr:hypothetical protein [Armatimonadota bacterium]